MFCNLFSLPKVYPLICILVSDTEFSFLSVKVVIQLSFLENIFACYKLLVLVVFFFENLKVTGPAAFGFHKNLVECRFCCTCSYPQCLFFASDFFQGSIVHTVGVGLSEDFFSAPVLLLPLDLPCVLPHENRQISIPLISGKDSAQSAQSSLVWGLGRHSLVLVQSQASIGLVFLVLRMGLSQRCCSSSFCQMYMQDQSLDSLLISFKGVKFCLFV